MKEERKKSNDTERAWTKLNNSNTKKVLYGKTDN